MTEKKKKAPVVAVLNMKGGVGKTTITANVFRRFFSKIGKSILLIDFDPQFNLTQSVVSQVDYDQAKQAGKTILSVMEAAVEPSMFTVNTSLGPPPELEQLAIKLWYLTNSPDTDLSIVPGDFGLVKYSMIEDSKLLVPVRNRFLDFIESCRDKKDLICIDCNPSSSFMTRCAVQAATHILVPVRPDRYSLLGLQMLDEFIDKIPNLKKRPKIIVLLNGLNESEHDKLIETTLRGHPKYGPLTLANSLKISEILRAKAGYTGFAVDKAVPHHQALKAKMSAISVELAPHLGLM